MTADEILQSVVAKATPAERAEYLDRVCENDASLRALVEVLLASLDKAGSFLEQPLFQQSATVDAPIHPEPLGTVIGPYKLMEQIGEGGMGLVYVAEQHQPVRRKVALKLIKPGMDTRQVIARFEAERQALALMDHPNIARVIDGGATANGRPYFVMELVRGVPITEYCDEQRLTPRARLELFRQVCAAVQHAHQKGIIHRDIKPSNVLVVSHDGTPVVKVIDFGVAKAIGQQLTEKTVYTQFAQFIGTPLYMSPEQAGQSGLDIDTRTDVYALGVLLYELLTGATPFDRDRIRDADYQEIRRIIREEEPPRPSTRTSTLNQQAGSTISAQRQTSPRELSILLRGELDWIVMKSLEKDRNRRYETPNALAADVERYLNDEPVEACPPSRHYLVTKFVRRHRTGILTATGLAAAVLLLAATLGWVVIDRASRHADADRKRLAIELAVADDFEEIERQRQLEKWSNVRESLERAKGRLMGSGLDPLEAKVEQYRRDLDMVARLDDAQLQSSNISTGGVRDWSGAIRSFEQAFAEYGLNLALLPPEASASQIRASAIRAQLVAALDFWSYSKERLFGSPDSSLKVIADLADIDAWRTKLRDPQIAKDRSALDHLVNSEQTLSQPPINLLLLSYRLDKANARQVAVQFLRQAQDRYPTNFWIAFELASQLGKESNTLPEAVGVYRVALALRPQSPVVYNNLGTTYWDQRKFGEAEIAFRKAIDLRPDFAFAHHNLGNSLVDLGKVREGEVAYRKSLDLDPDYADAHRHLGILLSSQGRLPEAVAEYQEAIKRNSTSPTAYNSLGNALKIQTKLSEAEAAYRKAIEFQPKFAGAYENLGSVLDDQQKWLAAESAYRNAIKFKDEEFKGAFKIDLARVYNNLGNCLSAQNRSTEALNAYRKAIELKPQYAIAYSNLGTELIKQGHRADAIVAIRTAIKLDHKLSQAHYNLGVALHEQKIFRESRAVLDAFLEMDPTDASGYYVRANLSRDEGKLAEAIGDYREAIRIDSNFAEPACNLGNVYLRLGRVAESIAELQRGHKLGTLRRDWEYPSSEWLHHAEQFAPLGDKMPKILNGELPPSNALETLALAWSQGEYSDNTKSPVRLYQRAFALDPKLADDLMTGNRFSAACMAVQAGCGIGKDASNIKAIESAELRKLAWKWLHDDLHAWRTELATKPSSRAIVRKKMRKWLDAREFEDVAQESGLNQLPQDERGKWRQLWDQVAELLRRAEEDD